MSGDEKREFVFCLMLGPKRLTETIKPFSHSLILSSMPGSFYRDKFIRLKRVTVSAMNDFEFVSVIARGAVNARVKL